MKKIRPSNVNALQFFQLARYGALMLIGILLAKSQLGTVNIGHYETFLLIAGAFTFFWVNGLLKVMMPLSGEKDEKEQPKLVFNLFLLLMAFSVLAGILVLFIHQPVSKLLLNGHELKMPWLLCLYIILNSPALLIEYVYLINKCPGKIITYAIIIFSLQIVAVGLPPFLGLGLETILYGLLGIALIKFIWLLNVLKHFSTASIAPTLFADFFRFGTPLILSTLLSSSARYIDGFIITSQFSPEQFAIFQYGARELPLALLLSNSLSMAMLPGFAKADLSSPLAEFRSEVYRLHWTLFPVSIALMLTSHWFYPLVFNPRFEASASIFNIYLLLVISRVLFPQTLIIAKKMNSVIVKASLFEIVVNVGLSLWWVRTMGITGVAYATVAAYLLEKIYLAIAVKKRLKINISSYLPVPLYLTSAAILLITFIFVEFIVY